MSDETKYPSNAYDKEDPFGSSSLVTKVNALTGGNDKAPERKKVHGREREKTFGQKIVDNVRSIDYKEFGNHLFFEWLVPEFIDSVGNFLKKIFYGDKNPVVKSNSLMSRASKIIKYNSMYNNNQAKVINIPKRNFRRIEVSFGPTDDGMSGQDNALEVLDQIREALATSRGDPPFITVREFYGICDMPTDSTMNRWGWYDLENVNIVQYGEEAVIEMPPAEVIE